MDKTGIINYQQTHRTLALFLLFKFFHHFGYARTFVGSFVIGHNLGWKLKSATH